mmetsp:Transcript_75813/g.88180  ORF Transcript_75813/g.88180 Transcript_75813/m.88180 type:complete len:97 (-) Transcript_75813:152-442(-)
MSTTLVSHRTTAETSRLLICGEDVVMELGTRGLRYAQWNQISSHWDPTESHIEASWISPEQQDNTNGSRIPVEGSLEPSPDSTASKSIADVRNQGP